MNRTQIEAEIRTAFAGVTLDGGISALQSEIIEEYGGGLTDEEFAALPMSERTDDWTALSSAELAHVLTPHLDERGLRYYLPALLIWLLDNYDTPWSHSVDAPMTVIWTMMALAPSDDSRDWWWRKYEAFARQQKTAIARYVSDLPSLVALRADEAAELSGAAEQFWNQFLG